MIIVPSPGQIWASSVRALTTKFVTARVSGTLCGLGAGGTNIIVTNITITAVTLAQSWLAGFSSVGGAEGHAANANPGVGAKIHYARLTTSTNVEVGHNCSMSTMPATGANTFYFDVIQGP